MLRSRSFDLLSRRLDDDKEREKTLPRLKNSYGADSPHLARDRAIVTDPEDNKRRRTIRLIRDALSVSWGFTLQTYGIRNKKTHEVEIMSYVDYVELRGPAWVAGMRRGDIIVSVNGDSVEYSTHMELVQRIKQCRREMRLVVLFENCCKKVEVHERYIKLKKLLSLKFKELKCLEEEERLLSQGVPLSRIDAMRRSTSSSISTCSDWDAYSEVTSPATLNFTPSNQFVFRNGLDSDTSSGSIAMDSSSFSSDKSQPNAVVSDSAVSCDNHSDSRLDKDNVNVDESESDTQSRTKIGDNSSESKSFVLINTNVNINNSASQSDNTVGLSSLSCAESDTSQSSGNSQVEPEEDEGLKHLYNVTRCAEHLTDACKCLDNNTTNGNDNIAAPRSIKEASKDDSSMTNLIDDCGVQLKAIDEEGAQKPSISPSSLSPSAFGKAGGVFFFERSDSDDSIMSVDVERNRSSGQSCELNTTEIVKDTECSSNSNGVHNSISTILESEKDEDEKNNNQDNIALEEPCIPNGGGDREDDHIPTVAVTAESSQSFSSNNHSINNSELNEDVNLSSDNVSADVHKNSAINETSPKPSERLNAEGLNDAEEKSKHYSPASSSPSPSPSSSVMRHKEQGGTDSEHSESKEHTDGNPAVFHRTSISMSSPCLSSLPDIISNSHVGGGITQDDRKLLAHNSNSPVSTAQSIKSGEAKLSSKRLVDGILVNDFSQSTRL